MLLPKQSPPIQRTRDTGKSERDERKLTPQMTCACRTVNGQSTQWCVIGRSFFNTREPCQT